MHSFFLTTQEKIRKSHHGIFEITTVGFIGFTTVGLTVGTWDTSYGGKSTNPTLLLSPKNINPTVVFFVKTMVGIS